jgi:hypothetical protein
MDVVQQINPTMLRVESTRKLLLCNNFFFLKIFIFSHINLFTAKKNKIVTSVIVTLCGILI